MQMISTSFKNTLDFNIEKISSFFFFQCVKTVNICLFKRIYSISLVGLLVCTIKNYASSRFNTIDYCLGGLALVVILILYFFVLIKFSSKKTLQIPESFFLMKFLQAPILILHADNDRLVPSYLGNLIIKETPFLFAVFLLHAICIMQFSVLIFSPM